MDTRLLRLRPSPLRDWLLRIDGFDYRSLWTRDAKALLGALVGGLALWWACRDWVAVFALWGPKIGAWIALVWVLGVRFGSTLTDKRHLPKNGSNLKPEYPPSIRTNIKE
jgi:hypothetical protein